MIPLQEKMKILVIIILLRIKQAEIHGKVIAMSHEIRQGTDMTLRCKMDNFDQKYYSAKWRRKGLNFDITTCWSAYYSPAECVPSSSRDGKYTYGVYDNDITLVIHNITKEDSGHWICVDPDNNKMVYNLKASHIDVLVPQPKCVLTQDNGLYQCSCTDRRKHRIIKWEYNTKDEIYNFTKHIDNKTRIDVNVNRYVSVLKDDLELLSTKRGSLSCGLHSHRKYISSNTVTVEPNVQALDKKTDYPHARSRSWKTEIENFIFIPVLFVTSISF